MKIGIFGGAFNPIHNGHILIAQQFIDFKIVDEVWLLPCYSHVWNKDLSPAEDRVKMIDLVLRCNLNTPVKVTPFQKIKLCSLELSLKKPMYAIDSVKILFKKYPQHNFVWIIGSDTLQTFDKWHQKDELLKLIHFYVAPKSSIPIPKKLPPNMERVDNPLWVETNLSSSLIRDRIKKGLSIKGLVPKSVEKCIIENHLYE